MYVDLYICGHGCDDSPKKNWFIETIEQIGCFNLKIYAIKTYVSISNIFLKTSEVIGLGEEKLNHEFEWPSTNGQ
jgi:hypothetical protein